VVVNHVIIFDAYSELCPFEPPLTFVLLWFIVWHAFMLLSLVGFTMWECPCLSLESLPTLGPSTSSPCMTALSLRRHRQEHAFSWLPCELCLIPCVGKLWPQVYFWLVGKLSILQPYLELCRFAHALLKLGLARWKVLLPLRVARELRYSILSEWMAYYSRYATGKKGLMLGFSCCN
jgi:hypothetical protein